MPIQRHLTIEERNVVLASIETIAANLAEQVDELKRVVSVFQLGPYYEILNSLTSQEQLHDVL